MAIVARGFPGLTFGTTPWSATDSTTKRAGQAKEAKEGLARCWQSFEISGCAKVTKDIKEEVRRHGFPPSIRADAYFFLSGGSLLQREHPADTYNKLAASTSNLSDDAIYNVEDDVRNARVLFKDTRLFSTAKGAEVLSRIIFAYIQRNPACGYFKGLAGIAALLLSTFGKEREEQVFWTLVALLERRFFPVTNGQVLVAARVEVHVLQVLLEQRLHALAAPLAKLGPEAMESLSYGWFLTAFTRVLPHEVVLRIWDCVVVEGPKVSLRVAMALIKMCASSVQSCTNIDVLCRVVEARLSRCQDANALLAVAFKGLGSLSGASVDAARVRALTAFQRSRSTCPAPLALGATGSVSGTLSTNSGGSTASGRAASRHASPRKSPKGMSALLSTA
ncbi:hypothetical protein PLESTB_000559900 [Pleodorina starrii]|uniref:Rab-GAP TBC domain-containing protein n=1 Tax=Pleodorina starrii TaxID=330485 RepID=A0A9W6BHH5_9CHLO|nr:hypothetical protein PLESTB_000559900 [Pleodorina starrii]GLC74571.1 hypothetical protein PLESTF_001528700 [Pleodorina starrii]